MAQDFAAHLAAAVRARRGALRLSQQDLADMAGVSERFVRFVEQGKPSLRLDTLLALLDTLGVELQLATRTSAAARALAAQPPAAQPLAAQTLVTQPPPAVPPSAAPLEGNGPSARESQP
ncbi:type II toxin-antitoxin system Y4mF family antitoxin [Arthrobacter sp. K5]|uniref:Type II toxin-antitoxin system Y4mF family antitoxin n=1 Tax=Arthrobacter sp. K5 TaxID=2839623 RepID=A0AAU8EJH6_9MICC